jgi:hypothetical protein
LNRYAFVVNNPLKYVDPSGHEDRDPWNESICKLLPMFCQPQSAPLIMGEQNETQLTVSQPIVMTGGIAIVEASSSEEEGKKGGGGGLLNLIRSILGGLGGGAAKKVIDEVSKDGDPTNEIRNVGNSANKFAEGFSRTEQQLVQSLVKKLGLENKGVTFWRGEGAPEAYRASAATDKPYITIFDGFFKLSRQQQLKALREEWNHLQQNINELSDDLIWYYEQQAKRGR